MPKINFSEIEKKLGYEFKNECLLEQAFTRSSYAAENPNSDDNEQLEFIGDSILSTMVVKKLSTRYMLEGEITYICAMDEGEMSRFKIELVQRRTLAAAIDRLGLREYLLVGKSDEAMGVRDEPSVKEDLFEAIIGAVAVDSCWNFAILEALVDRMLCTDRLLEENDIGGEARDYEAELEAWLKAREGSAEYVFDVQKCEGLAYACKIKSLLLELIALDGLGYGATERGARRMAARRAMEHIEKTAARQKSIDGAVGAPDIDRAVTQLKELAQKKIIAEPVYTFEEVKDRRSDSGNPLWSCSCTVEGVDDVITYEDTSKAEAKKCAAYEMLNLLRGLRVLVLFEKYGEEI